MNSDRRNKILEIVASQEIDTQTRLTEKLKKYGFNVNQATVSRDIRELGLIKKPGKSGRSCYAIPAPTEERNDRRFRQILKETILSMTPAENLIVIKTLSGCANAAAEMLDTSDTPLIVGTIAGDNTLLVIVDNKGDVPAVMEMLSEAIK